jgi:sugar phosphate isomerase/epimerase
MKFGFTAYGTTFDMGIHPESGRAIISALDFIRRAEEYGFQGVEIPYDILKAADLDEVGQVLRDQSMFATIAAGGYDVSELKSALQAGRRIGASTVRTVVGGADYGGDRRHMKGKWQAFLEEIQTAFAQVIETAENTTVNLAVENHQDLASEELIAMCEMFGSERFGITLDTANPLATAEEPMDFYTRVAPYVKNVHLKDYRIYWYEDGYRLVRCPVGQGVVDFIQLLKLYAKLLPSVTMSLEHGALVARNVRVLCEDYWTEYPARSAVQLTKLMRFIFDHAKASGEWRTPYELGVSPDEVREYELKEVASSSAFLMPLIKQFSNC